MSKHASHYNPDTRPTQPPPSPTEQPEDTDWEEDGPVDEADVGGNSAPGDTGSD